MHADTADHIESLWASYDLITSELVKAKRHLREGTVPQSDVDWLRAERLDIGSELAALGQPVDPAEPGGD